MPANPFHSDEDVLLLPGDWDPPFAVRGETEAKPVKARARHVVEGILAVTAHEAAAVLAREAVAPEVASAPADSPLRAATLAYIADRNTGGRFNDLRQESRESRTLRRNLADAWVAGHGLAFAVRAVADLARMAHDSRLLSEFDTHFMRQHDPQRFENEKHHGLRRVDEARNLEVAGPVLVRLREILAGAPAEDYAAVLDTLATLRADLPVEMRVLTSFMAPTQASWIEEDVATWDRPTIPDWQKSPQTLLLTGCVRDPDRLVSLIGKVGTSGALPGLLTTYVSIVGERAVEYFKVYGDSGKWLWALPYDSAYRVQRDRMQKRDALPWLALASERFPARAVRLLAEDDQHELAAELLRQHVIAYPEVAAQVQPKLTAAQQEKVAVVRAELDAVGPGEVPPVLAQPPWKIATGSGKRSVRIPEVWSPLRSGVLPPLLRDGTGRLPASAVPDLLTVYTLSTLEKPYEAVAAVEEALDPADLARFAWDLLRRWCTTGTLPKHDWVFTVLGLAGNDDTVRRLAKIIHSVPYSLGARVGRALDAMQAIGTETALIELQRVAQRSSSRQIRKMAEQRIADVAARLELTAEQLEDRLVPDFGLAATATLTIDYGPRFFVARFDEKLTPYITDESGRRLGALPRPGERDDRQLAEASAKSFLEVKKNIRMAVSALLLRYERAMVERYEWSVADFQTYLAGHRLVGHIVRRLLWAVDGVPVRIAEDGTFADVDDELVEAAEGMITIAHPVQLGTDLEAWVKIFDDYQLLQPFPQLTRDTYQLTVEEAASGRLTRFEGFEVNIGRLRSLERRGWRPGNEEHGGTVYEFSRRFPRGGGLTATLEPGFPIAGDRAGESRLNEIELDGENNPIACSELIRDLTGVVAQQTS